MIDALALAALDMIPAPVPNFRAISTRDDAAQEVRRLADLFWGVCRARGLGEESVTLPRVFVRWETKAGITGCYTGGRGITISLGTTTWGAVVECLLHELCHALEPRAAHGPRFAGCLTEAVDALFGVAVDPFDCTDTNAYDLDRRILAELESRFDWARERPPPTGTPYDFLVARLRRSAARRGAVLVVDDLDLLRLAAPGAHVQVRGTIRLGDDVHTLTWNLRAPSAPEER